jgi:drug/metabolite transporter (DMT)-like permease
LQIIGIVLALEGIALVVVSHEDPPDTPHGHTRRGVMFGVLAGLGQAVGLVFSRQGMLGDFSPFQANAIRMLATVIFVWILASFDGKATSTFKTCKGSHK